MFVFYYHIPFPRPSWPGERLAARKTWFSLAPLRGRPRPVPTHSRYQLSDFSIYLSPRRPGRGKGSLREKRGFRLLPCGAGHVLCPLTPDISSQTLAYTFPPAVLAGGKARCAKNVVFGSPRYAASNINGRATLVFRTRGRISYSIRRGRTVIFNSRPTLPDP